MRFNGIHLQPWSGISRLPDRFCICGLVRVCEKRDVGSGALSQVVGVCQVSKHLLGHSKVEPSKVSFNPIAPSLANVQPLSKGSKGDSLRSFGSPETCRTFSVGCELGLAASLRIILIIPSFGNMYVSVATSMCGAATLLVYHTADCWRAASAGVEFR